MTISTGRTGRDFKDPNRKSRPADRKPRITNKAFTFIEVLITIVLLVVGTVALLQMFGTIIFAEADVENSTTALYLTQEKMEEIKDAASYDDIDGFASSRADLTGDFADFDREVTVSGDPKQVNVIVYWQASGSDQSVNLVSLLSDYDY